jgi:hypothetical protein
MHPQYTEMPIMISCGVYWDRTVPFVMLSEVQAYSNHSQTLQRLAERGGLGPDEALALMDKRRWMPMKKETALRMLTERLERYK